MNSAMKTTDPKLLSEKRNARWRILVCVLFAALIPELHASPTTVTLRPVADAELQQAQPDSNIGGNITMVSGELGIRVGGVLRRAVLRFDLAGQIPAGAIINSVSLQVRVMRVPIGPANSIFDLRRILQPWSESGVTWNSRLPATPWQVPGVTGAADSVSAASSTVFVSGLGSYTFPSTPALIADVQAWANDPSTNSGWLLISEGEGILKTARHFATHEDAVNGPVLTVIYTQPPPVILTEPLDQTKVEGDTATFAVLADGTPPLNYQWQFNDNDLLDQTNSALTLTGVSTNDAGFYRVIVNNVGGSTSSREALLTVLPLDEVLPRVTISSPASGVKFREHSDVPVTATVTTSNATLSSVEFFTNGTSFAIFSNSPVSFVLSNLAAGQYDLRARATDSATNTGEATVSFRVQTPPRVAITSPTAGLRLPINSNVTVVATTEFPTLAAEITSVDFFENDVQIGNSVVAPPFSVNWIPATLGDRTLTARAVDDLGQIGTNSIRVFVFLRENSLPTVAIT
ncbi:MAG: DNRLRE domain-containing protein, partial [Verrucomicrobia bacterium]